MKQSELAKKRKKEMTWAEAATEVLERSSSNMLTIGQIQEKIFDMKLKDFKMCKQSENALKTMLNQHAIMEDCPFYKVKDKINHYALKKYYKYSHGADSDSSVDIDEDSNISTNSLIRKSKRKASLIIADIKSNQAKLMKKPSSQKIGAPGSAKVSSTYTRSQVHKTQVLSRRRTSSPNVMQSSPHSNLRSRAQLQSVHRSQSVNCLQGLPSVGSNNKSRSFPPLDLETPSSTLTNTRLKSVLNSATFSMLPALYQYELVQLLPDVDKVIDENGVPRMSQTALNNEFFSQALVDWITQLSEGEFTRETQARIMHEIAKERSKIHPWKEKFFEEYYGQKNEQNRTRTRSNDATSNMTDLSFEAQLSKFNHLCSTVDEEQTKTHEDKDDISVDYDTDSDQDSEFVKTRRPKADIKPMPQQPQLKHISRRKISKPFKRTVVSSGNYNLSTAMIHRKAISSHSNTTFNRTSQNLFEKFRSHNVPPSRFQIRDEFYRSDSEASDEGEVSDSNSFHQHDESESEFDENQSSDEMMNVGDDNLMDVDSDSDPDCVNPDHSYTRLPDLNKVRRRSSDDRDWRRRQLQGLASVKPVISTTGDEKITTQNTMLVLRPKGNLEQAVQAMDYSEDSSSTSPEQSYKILSNGQTMFEKILTVSKENTSREERVGVLFGRNLQPTASTYHGESIIPRISTTNGLLSCPISPATVCTSTTSASVAEQSKVHSARSEDAVTLKPNKNNNNVKPTCGDALDDLTTKSSFVEDYHLRMTPVRTEIENNRQTTIATKSISKPVEIGDSCPVSCDTETSSSPSVKTEPFQASFPTEPVAQLPSKKGASADATPVETVAKLSGETQNKECPGSPVLSSAKHLQNKAHSPIKVTSKLSPVLPSTQETKSSGSSSSPMKRTRTLAEIKAQMKAKRLAAASNSPVKTSLPPQTSMLKTSVTVCQPIFCHTSNRSTSVVVTEDQPKVSVSTAIMTSDSVTKETVLNLPSKSVTETQTPKSTGKIILKIKSQEGKKYSVKVDTVSPTPDKTTKSDGDSEAINDKNKQLNQVVSSSGESGDDLEKSSDSCSAGPRLIDSYSMLRQLSFPGMYSGKTVSAMETNVLKRTQKSPVFGEAAFESLPSFTRRDAPSPSVSNHSASQNCQPFVTDKPVIGFQDIQTCKALSSSNATTFMQPCTAISNTNYARKYPHTSKGKNLNQMQELARTNQIPSDDSEIGESDTEEDSVASTTSSAEDETANDNNFGNKTTGNNAVASKHSMPEQSINNGLRKSGNNQLLGNESLNSIQDGKEVETEESDCEDSYSSSSNDEKSIITNCVCACKRLVSCRGCGAYTHEECLSSSKLCSLCCV